MAEKRQSTEVVSPHESHGNSVAAWTAVAILMVGFLLLVIAWVRQDIPLYIVAAVVIAAGAATGKVLAMMGFGEKHHDS
jgi:hypothetical protein